MLTAVYISITTAISAILLSVNLALYLKNRNRQELMFALIFLTYILSDIYILLLSNEDGALLYPTLFEWLSVVLRVGTYVFVFGLIRAQGEVALSNAEKLILLLLGAASFMCGLINSDWNLLYDCLIFVPVWGIVYLSRNCDGARNSVRRLIALMYIYLATKILDICVCYILPGVMPVYNSPAKLIIEWKSELIMWSMFLISSLNAYEEIKRLLTGQFIQGGDENNTRSLYDGLNDALIKLGKEKQLTQRELEVCRLAMEGKSNKQIAERLFLSEGTIKVHLHNIYQKLGISRRSQIVSYLNESADKLS